MHLKANFILVNALLQDEEVHFLLGSNPNLIFPLIIFLLYSAVEVRELLKSLIIMHETFILSFGDVKLIKEMTKIKLCAKDSLSDDRRDFAEGIFLFFLFFFFVKCTFNFF